MKQYFLQRHKLTVEYSGHQDASIELRKRLFKIISNRLTNNRYSDSSYWLDQASYDYELEQYLGISDLDQIFTHGEYGSVFQATEIFIQLIKNFDYRLKTKIVEDLQRAFLLSGSVYQINNEGEIVIKIDENTASHIENAKNSFNSNHSSYSQYYDAVGNLLSRKSPPKDVVKNIYVALEDYLKTETKQKGYKDAVNMLEKQEIISATQKQILEKIQGFRGDSYAVTHAGNSKEPDEIDALWFADTVACQVIMLTKKLKER